MESPISKKRNRACKLSVSENAYMASFSDYLTLEQARIVATLESPEDLKMVLYKAGVGCTTTRFYSKKDVMFACVGVPVDYEIEFPLLQSESRKSRNYGQFIKKIRLDILNKFNCSCAYCGTQLNEETLRVDHIIPRSRFNLHIESEKHIPYFLKDGPLPGMNDINNLFPACNSCNVKKSYKSIEGFRQKCNEGKQFYFETLNPATHA